MDFEALVQARKSIRGFKNEPVPRDVIEDIIEVAKRAPSSMNTQPWHVHVLTGAPLEQVRKRNMEAMMVHAKPKREINVSDEYQGIHRTRQVDIAKKLFGAMGIARDDKQRRQDWVLRGFRQFDAPVSLVITYDRPLELNVILLRSRRALLRHRAGRVESRPGNGHQRTGNHALGYRTRSCQYS